MACIKCGYIDKQKKFKNQKELCKICFHFSPDNENDFNNYIQEKIDWKSLETFRKYNQTPGQNQKKGMQKKANQGKLMTRPAKGYTLKNGKLQPNEDASKIHSLFKTFLQKDYSLNSLAKNYGFSVNGVKKILSNRTYLGEIKFAGKLSKGNHQAIISPEIFYAVQRKLKEKSRS